MVNASYLLALLYDTLRTSLGILENVTVKYPRSMLIRNYTLYKLLLFFIVRIYEINLYSTLLDRSVNSILTVYHRDRLGGGIHPRHHQSRWLPFPYPRNYRAIGSDRLLFARP